MANLGGSPLGLIGIKSIPTNTGMSTFNGGASRNINVNRYNTGKSNGGTKGTESLLTGKSIISPYANIGKVGTENGGGLGYTNDYQGISKNTLHNNDVYDTSLLNIIEKLSRTEASLRPSDFAYLKDVGVYPNNRLMIARRFLNPHTDNIYGKAFSNPMAVMISWKPQDDEFFSISFNEVWEDAKADFTDILNDLGKEFDIGGKLSVGGVASAAAGAIPLPGFTESLQRAVLTKMGILDADGKDSPLPSGNPNLIKVAKRRKTVPFESADSGLKCTVSVKMNCEWEQKFISGIDPTIVWQDIVSSVVRFGTSRSDVYGLSKNFGKQVEKWVTKPETIVTDMIGFITDALTSIKEDITNLVSKFFDDKSKSLSPAPEQSLTEKQAALTSAKAEAIKAFDELIVGATTAIKKTIQKYRIAIIGIANALSGMPSTPWHLTIGNPLRPIFCAGDMLTEDVTLSFGPTLAFNDLPSTIKADFTLTNARPWGLQEILAKFNAGSLRVTNGIRDTNSLNSGETLSAGKRDDNTTINATSSSVISGAVTPSGVQNTVNVTPNTVTNNATQIKDIQGTATIPTTVTGNTFGNNIGPLTEVQSQVTPTTIQSGIPPILSGLSTTKEGNSGEQINPFATSTNITTNIDISSTLNKINTK